MAYGQLFGRPETSMALTNSLCYLGFLPRSGSGPVDGINYMPDLPRSGYGTG